MSKIKEIVVKIICWAIILVGAIAGMVTGQILAGLLFSLL